MLKEKTKVLTGADILLDALKQEGIEIVFGYPGGAVLPLYDALYDTDITHILPRHEQGAIHAAEGYARISGKPGVVIATSGPGATNILTGLADAMIDSLPLVVFTGQVATSLIGSDAFQEADMIGLTTPITKHNYQVRSISDIPRIVKEAFHIATTGRPGPVIIDLPKDMVAGAGEKVETPDIYLPGYQPTYEPNSLQVQRLLDAVAEAQKPVILAGAGVLHAKAHQELTAFAEMYQIPVVHTLLGLGAFSAENPLFLGMGGMHGTYTANMALYEADLLINFGARFDDRLTGNLAHFAQQAVVAHIDIDPVEIGKNVPTQIPIVGCAKCTLKALLKKEGQKENHWEWLALQQKRKAQYPLRYEKSDKVIKPQTVIELIHQLTNGEAIITTDVGQHQMWAAQYYPFQQPHRWVTSGGLGTMGFGFPAAIGAQFAEQDAVVVSIVGDGGFQMTLQELSLLREYQLPIKVVIVNNSALGMVRQWQESFYEARYSHSLFQEHPDFVMLAAAYGIRGVRITEPTLLKQQLKDTIEYDGPVLIDCCVVQSELVNPMIPPGKGIHEMEGV